jgi:hypothetical protein
MKLPPNQKNNQPGDCLKSPLEANDSEHWQQINQNPASIDLGSTSPQGLCTQR